MRRGGGNSNNLDKKQSNNFTRFQRGWQIHGAKQNRCNILQANGAKNLRDTRRQLRVEWG